MSYYDTLSRMLRKKKALNQKYQDFRLIAIFVGLNFRVEYFGVKN